MIFHKLCLNHREDHGKGRDLTDAELSQVLGGIGDVGNIVVAPRTGVGVGNIANGNSIASGNTVSTPVTVGLNSPISIG